MLFKGAHIDDRCRAATGIDHADVVKTARVALKVRRIFRSVAVAVDIEGVGGDVGVRARVDGRAAVTQLEVARRGRG